MTDITDEQVAEWAKEASKHALIKWFAKAAKESPGFFRRFAELARQDEREAFATRSSIATFREGDMWGICYRTTDKADADDVLAGLRARGSDK